MWDMFKAELVRFRIWAVAGALLHLLVLAFLARVVDLAQQPMLVYRVFGAVYAVTGLLLGLYQMGGYRRPNAWLNLLHRPMPTWKIAAALFGAGALLLALAVAMPILVVAVYQETMTARVVDLRHWLVPLASCLIAACGYLAGAFCMLGGRRYAACSLVFLVLLVVAKASGFSALALQSLILLWLAVMVLAAFKPDLSAPPRSTLAVVATALPVQMGVYLLVLLLGFGVEMLWIMQGSHPNNMSTPPRGGHNETERLSDKDRMLAGLAASTAPEAPLWREQVALSDILGVGSQLNGVPARNELTNTAPMEFEDSERRMRWVFSHDRMRFEGYSLVDGRSVGELGVGADAAAFPAPAVSGGGLPGLPQGDSVLIAGGELYHYASETRQVLPRIRLPAGEILVGANAVGENLGVLSDRAVYFFDGRDVVEDDRLLAPRQRVSIPGPFGEFRSQEIVELVDGYLMSFTFTNHAHDTLGIAPYQVMLRVDDAGRVTSVARRAIAYDYPALYRYKAWWPSPAMYALRMGAIGLFAAPDPLQEETPSPVPLDMRALAYALMALSLLAAIWLTRRQALSSAACVTWIVACGTIGLPALASLWLLYPQREQIEEVALLQPAPA